MMKRIINTLLCSIFVLPVLSCQQELIFDVPVNESIILDLSSGITKAAHTDTESYVDHLDIFIFESDDNGKPAALATHETVVVNNQKEIVLEAKRSDFVAGDAYLVYLLANSTADFSGIENFSQLNQMKQEDMNLHLTGLNVSGAPQYFLMDAVAKDSEGNSLVVLNDGVPENNTMLEALLARAAAKVVINIAASERITFVDYGISQGSEGGLFYVRNMPYETWVLAETQKAVNLQNVKLRTTVKTDTEYFTWNPGFESGSKKVSLTTYVYPHHWNDESILEKETCAVLNLPLDYKKSDTETVPYHNSWYKVPMTDNATFERNNLYEINITLDRPGASAESEPVILDEISYSVEDWTGVDVVVNGEDRPDYLQLNTNHVNMYNVNIDDSSLKFASSSEISKVTLDEAYYINYLGNKIDVRSVGISASAESEVLNGNITINSPFVAMTDAEKMAAIEALEKPIPVAEPGEPEGKPTPPEVVEKPSEDRPEDPRNNPELWDEIAEKYSNKGYGWGSYTVTYEVKNTDKGKEPVFKDDSRWEDASEKAQAEFDSLCEAYDNYDYDALLRKYNEYLAALANYEKELEDWNIRNASYLAALSDYEAYQQAVKEYNDAVAAINRSTEDLHENAIRYMTFTVENETGQKASFTVTQYPTIYITHEMGYYSYRSDFGGTNYEKYNKNSNISGADWDNNNWKYSMTASNDVFFGSKVRTGNEGNYSINYAYYSEKGSRQVKSINGLNNPRMYHVHVTATSSEYIVGIPRLDDNGYTESSADNTRLVSPSFMIASQLGATQTPDGGIAQARSHCEQYIEVADDGSVYDDWRLPTAAEIDIIIQHQDISDAMAVVLSGQAYYCAYNGVDKDGNAVYTKATGKTGAQNAVRCIRDIY